MVVLTQLPILFFIGGTRDLLFGFNQTSEGLMTLIVLFFFVPILNLAWVVAEIRRSALRTWKENRAMALLLPTIAILFFVESLAIDIYILSQARM